MREIGQTARLLASAGESLSEGDYAAVREHTDSAWENWRGFTEKGNYVLADLSIIADATVSMSRIVSLSKAELSDSDVSERFREECAATILMLEHFLSDNQDIGEMGGIF
jgi:hypothetical protein